MRAEPRWSSTNESGPHCLPDGRLGQQEVLGLPEPVVRGEDDPAAQRGAAQVVQLTPARGLGPSHSEWSVSHQGRVMTLVQDSRE